MPDPKTEIEITLTLAVKDEAHAAQLRGTFEALCGNDRAAFRTLVTYSFPRDGRCPKCDAPVDHFSYVETADKWWSVRGIAEGTLVMNREYKVADDGHGDAFIECGCGARMALPAHLDTDWK